MKRTDAASRDDTAWLVAQAGLGRAQEQFPDDVAAAIRSAATGRAGLGSEPTPTVEPFPPIRRG